MSGVVLGILVINLTTELSSRIQLVARLSTVNKEYETWELTRAIYTQYSIGLLLPLYKRWAIKKPGASSWLSFAQCCVQAFGYVGCR